jgi:four helix bundle protein
MKVYSFEKLEVWKGSRDFVLKVYKLVDNFPNSERYGIVDQLKRSAVSIPTNLAEGTGRNTGKDKVYFTQIAFGSLMECLNLLIISNELGFVKKSDLSNLRKDIETISTQLSNYRRSQLSKSLNRL